MAEVTPIRPDIIVPSKKRRPRGPTQANRFVSTLEDIQAHVYRARALVMTFAGALESADVEGLFDHPQDVCIGIADLLAAIESQIELAAAEIKTPEIQR